jgi:hypothetical protein
MIWVVVVALYLSGCAGMNYDSKISSSTNDMKAGNLDQAIDDLESNNTSDDKGLLYYMEKGELQRMKGSYGDSRDTWFKADQKVREWEDQVKTDPSKLLGDIGSVLVNDTTRRYDGRDYEKVLLNVELALDHLALNSWSDARIEIKKMHEREAIIAEFRSKELEDAKEKANSKGVKATSFKELKGYPIETLEDPEVQGLKNSYESAFANYLAGFVYESLGEISLAAPGYRKAAEMRPNNPLIDEALSGLDKRIKSRRSKKTVDTLFVIESESAPAIQSQQLGLLLPIPCSHGICPTVVQMSWPVVRPIDTSNLITSISIDDHSFPVAMLTSVDAMARRAISDEMPGIIARSSVRAIAKAAGQKLLDDHSDALGPFGALISLAAKVGTAVSEKADERAWRTLPGFYSIARAELPAGTHKLLVQTANGPQIKEIQLSGKHAVIALRDLGSNLVVANYIGPDSSPGGQQETKKEAELSTSSSTSGNAGAPVVQPKKKKKLKKPPVDSNQNN